VLVVEGEGDVDICVFFVDKGVCGMFEVFLCVVFDMY